MQGDVLLGHPEQLDDFQPLGIVFETAANVDTLQHFCVDIFGL